MSPGLQRSLAFNENLRVSDFVLTGCREFYSEGTTNFHKMYAIKDLLHNKPKFNEHLRTKMFVLGFDIYTVMTTSGKTPNNQRDKYYRIILSGFGRSLSQINMNMGLEIAGGDCIRGTENITDSFYYTEIELVVSKGYFKISSNIYSI